MLLAEDSLEKLVLIIEDDPDMQNILQLYLAKMKLQSFILTKGKHFLEEVLHRKPDLICLDINLPDASGFDLCVTLKVHPITSSIPILVISAKSLPTDEAEALKAGANGYLSKPLNKKTFSEEIKRLLKV